MREACQLSNADFAKMHLRYSKVYQTVLSQHQSQYQSQTQLPSRSEPRPQPQSNRPQPQVGSRPQPQGGYSQVAKYSTLQTPQNAQNQQKFRRGRKDSESNSAKSSQEKEIEEIIDTVDELNKKSKPVQRPVESDDETDQKKQDRRKLCRRGYWVINKVVKQLCDQDKKDKTEDQQRQIRYAAQATQYAAQMMAKPADMAQKQRNIMVKNVQNQLNEIQSQGRQGGQVPQYQEHFPKLQREDREDNQPTIPDFKPLPQFAFREPPPLHVNLDIDERMHVPPDRNSIAEPINLDLDIAVFQDHGPQEMDPRNLSGQSLHFEQVNRRKHNPNQSGFIMTDKAPSGKMAYQLIDSSKLNRRPGGPRCDTDELIVVNDKKKPIGCKVDLLNRALAGHEVDQRTQMEASQHMLQVEQIDQKNTQEGITRLNSLFEKEIGIEDPEVYNQKERKPGVHKERYMYGNPMRDRSMLNQLGILKKSTVIGNNSHVVAQLESQNSQEGTTTVKPTLKLFNREFVSYFELMKTVIEQKVFDNLGEVGRVMNLTEQTGLRMIEWTLTRSDSSILTYRCKRYPLCQARVNFQMYVGGTDRVKLVSTHLKHCHQPDWTEKSRIDRDVWAVLTHPNVQTKIAQTANKKYGDIDLCYFAAEEAAIVENIDFSCVNRDQFGKFMEIYHCTNKVGGTVPRKQLRSIHMIQSKGNMSEIFEQQSQMSQVTQNQQIGSQYATAQSLLTVNIPQLPKMIDLDGQKQTQNQPIVMEDLTNVAVPQSNLNSEIPGGRLVHQQQKIVEINFNEEIFQDEQNGEGDQVDELELFCQAADICSLNPNAKALVIQQQLRTQFGDTIEIFCSNDESMLFFTFSEQIQQAPRFMQQPGGSTMLVQSGFKTQMPGMSLIMFCCQAQSNMNFIIMAGCLIIETLAQNTSRQVDYKWLFQAYSQSKLPEPKVCLTEFNEPFYRAMRRAWPKTQHLWSTYSIVRNGGKILADQKTQQIQACNKAIFSQFKTWIRNCTKTKQHFNQGYKQLKTSAKQSQAAKMPIFLLYLKRIKSQKAKWAMFELAQGFDHVTCGMARRSQGSLFQPNKCLFYGDLLLMQKQKYLFRVVQQVLHKQQGMKLSQVIRAFEYLSCFGYQKQLLPASKIKDPLSPPFPVSLQSEQFIARACINLAETSLCKYFAQKLVGMASKIASYKVQAFDSKVYVLTQEKGLVSITNEDSIDSADSDILADSQFEIQVSFSSLDGLLHCDCNSVRLLGYPCVHILRVAAYTKQLRNLSRLDCVDNYALQFEDIQKYFADHIGKSVDVDILQFDTNSCVTLDREKHSLAEVLFESGQLLPAIDRGQLFDKLIQDIKMQKLMSYQPKVIDVDDSEERMKKSFGQSTFLKMSQGSLSMQMSSVEVLLVMLQDLRAKQKLDATSINQDLQGYVLKALDLLDNKDFCEASTIVAKQLSKDASLASHLEQVLCLQTNLIQSNRTCQGFSDKMQVDLDAKECPYYELTINDLQRHGFIISQCLAEKLTVCECGSCPEKFQIINAPKTIFVQLEGHRLVFDDICLERTFLLNSNGQQYTYQLEMITLQHVQPVRPSDMVGQKPIAFSSLLIDKPAVASTQVMSIGDGVAYDAVWPGWFFFSAGNARARLFEQGDDESQNFGFAHALSTSQTQFISRFEAAQKVDKVLARHRKMHQYEKKYGVKPQFLVYTLQKIERIQVEDVMTVDLDSGHICLI